MVLKSTSKFTFRRSKDWDLTEGADAAFALINLWEPMTVYANEMHSKGKYTPFEGVQFNARVERTYLRGKLISSRDGKNEVKLGYGVRIVKIKFNIKSYILAY